jgi:hypothetical protein
MVKYENRVLKDGERLRFQLELMDSVQRDIAGTRSETVVLDGGGRPAGSRPGQRYLATDTSTTDHAVQVAREFNREAAYADGVREMCDAWRGTNRDLYEVPRVHDTGDPKCDAYLDSVYDLQNAWHRGTGKR